MRVSNAIRLERNADVARIDGMMEGPDSVAEEKQKRYALDSSRAGLAIVVRNQPALATADDRNGLGCTSVIIPGRSSIAEPFTVQRQP
jgi:hypothetical protein